MWFVIRETTNVRVRILATRPQKSGLVQTVCACTKYSSKYPSGIFRTSSTVSVHGSSTVTRNVVVAVSPSVSLMVDLHFPT